MANLQVKDIDDKLYQSLKLRASREKRSVSQEVVLIIEKYLASPDQFQRSPTLEFLQMSGSWAENRTAEEIVNDLRKSRQNSDRFGDDHELFD